MSRNGLVRRDGSKPAGTSLMASLTVPGGRQAHRARRYVRDDCRNDHGFMCPQVTILIGPAARTALTGGIQQSLSRYMRTGLQSAMKDHSPQWSRRGAWS